KESITTDANGEVQVADLPFGNYDLIETKAPVGYELSSEITRITIDANNSEVTKVIKNNILINKQVTLLKKDGVSKELLDGSEFIVQRYHMPGDNPSNFDYIVMGPAKGGKLSFEASKPGKYVINEINPPFGYVKLTKPIEFFVYPNGTISKVSDDTSVLTESNNNITLDVFNDKIPVPTGTLNIKKIDSKDDSKVLEGAEFKLVQGDKVIKEGIVTDANGVIQVADLPYGDYELVETKAPVGYELSKEVVKVTIDKDHVTVDQVVKNEKTPDPTGTLNIKKLDSHDYSKVLEGAEFKLVQGDKVIKEGITTDANGEVQVSDLPYGDYELVETKAPSGYELTTEVFKVTIDKETPVANIEVHNVKSIDNLITINKKDRSTGGLLDGATFKVKRTEKGDIISEPSIDVTEGTVTNGQFTFKVKDSGVYWIEEVNAPSGYLKLDRPIEIIVDEDGFVTKGYLDGRFDVNNISASEATVDIYNEKIVDIDIHKKSSLDGKSLSDASFSVKKLCGNEIFMPASSVREMELPMEAFICKIGTDEMVADEIITDENGLANVKLPGYGAYEIKEIKAPIGYKSMNISKFIKVDENGISLFDKDPYDFNAKLLQSNIKTLEVENEPEVGTLNIKKVDSQEETKVLEGAEFKLVQGDKVIKEGIVTDAKGEVQVADLPYGEYDLIETKAPVGYELSTEVIKVMINEYSHSMTYFVQNNKSKEKIGILHIEKVDGSDWNKKLEGAEFKILQNGKVIEEKVVTDNEGKFIIKLPEGNYELIETKAPDGYKIGNDNIKIIILDGLVRYQIVENVKLPDPITTEAPTTEAPTTEKPTTEAPTTEKPTTEKPTTEEPTTEASTTEKPTTEKPTTEEPTTEKPTTEKPTTEEPTTEKPTTEEPTTEEPTTEEPTTEKPTTEKPATEEPTTEEPTTEKPTTEEPTTEEPTTEKPTTEKPTTEEPTTEAPTTEKPTTEAPTTEKPTTEAPTTEKPTTEEPTTEKPTTEKPTTEKPTTEKPTTEEPTTEKPTTEKPTTEEPTTENPTTEKPTTEKPTTEEPTTEKPTTEKPTTEEPTTEAPTTEKPTTEAPTTEKPTTEAPTTEKPTTEKPTTEKPTTEAPTTEKPTTEKPTTEEPTTEEPTTEKPTTEEPTTE
ncbi:SpaA isopeptide-forming pilin-related protein, partial [Macrococcus capreoli]|uniref:SpaA isopeptide-forming pilin-related protein n=1 Tax=Macrococcus capreoli TaxID=2982690 RepID=UPI003F43FE21